MFLTHLLTDLQQPLHCAREADDGGVLIEVNFRNHHNPKARHSSWGGCRWWFVPWIIRYGWGCQLNLHMMWDDSIIDETIENDFAGSRDALELDLWEQFL